MSFATTATPGGKSQGTQDLSRETIPATPIVSSMTTGFVGILAERGRGHVQLTTTAASVLYGTKTFDKDSPFYHHSTELAKELSTLGIPLFIKRFIPADAKKALLRVSLEIIPTDLPTYERNSDGSIKMNVDLITGLETPVIDGTIQGTRGIIHVGTSMYPAAARGPKMGTVMDDFRNGNVTVGGKFLGEITRSDLSKEHPKSRLLPLFDLEVDSEGAYGNNVGVILSTPNYVQVNPAASADVIKNKSFPIRIGVVERDSQFSSSNPVPKLDGDLQQDVFLKSKAVDAIGGHNVSFGRKMIEEYNRKMTADQTPIWGPFGIAHVYEKNIAEIQQILSEGYTYTDQQGADINIAGEVDFDDDAFDFGRTSAYAFNDPLNYGLFNFLTAREMNNVPYFSFSVADSLTFGGVAINEESELYAEGGDDGLWYHADGTPAHLVNLKMLDDAYRGFMRNFGAGTDKLKDILRYPITQIIDSGWSTETKLAHANVLLARPDIHLEIGTQQVAQLTEETVDIGPVYKGSATNAAPALSAELLDGWNWAPRLTGDQDDSAAERLRGHFADFKESTFFGTPVMRVHVFGHSGYSVRDTYEHNLPGSFDRGLAMAAFTGVTAWSKPDDFTEDDNRKPRFLKELNYVYREEEAADKSWATGLNFLRAHDIVDEFWPAVQSIYPHKDSVLNNAKFVLAASKCHYFGMEVWRSVSGENKTDLQFKQDLEDEANRLIAGRFTEDVRIIPEAILTDADKARGYSGYLKFHIGVGKPRTKLVYSVHGYSLDQLNERQGLPA